MRKSTSAAANAALCWGSIVVCHTIAPADLRHIVAAPVLQSLFFLTVALAATIAAALAILAPIALRVGARTQPGAVGAAASAACVVLASALVVALQGPLHTLAERGGLPSQAGLAMVLVAGAVLSAILIATATRRAEAWSASAWSVLAAAVAATWLASAAWAIDARIADPRLVVLAAPALATALVTWSAAEGLPATFDRTRARWCVAVLGVAVPVAISIVSAAGSAAGRGIGGVAEQASPTNVVMLMIDTWRADHTSLGGHAVDTTPHLAAAASRSATYFAHAGAAAPSTVPSVKSLFTGRAASSWGLELGNEPPPPSTFTLARSFHEAGFATACISTNPLIEGEGFRNGFDYFWSAGGYRYFLKSLLLNDLLSGDRTWEVFRTVERMDLHKIRGSTAARLARSWLERNATRPFFLYLHIVEPHWPYHDRGWDLVPERLRALEQTYSHVDLMRLPLADPKNAALVDRDKLTELVARYDEEVRAADEVLADLLRNLDELGLRETTLVVVVGDHGEEFMEHHGFGHGHDVFEEQVHVPLVFLWPHDPSYAHYPARVDRPVSLLDVFPTLSALLPLRDPGPNADGRSLLPLLNGSADSHPAVVSEAFLANKIYSSYREGPGKLRFRFDYVAPPASTPHVLHFDLESDARELEPQRADVLKDAAIVQRARAALETRWQRGVSASSTGAGGSLDPAEAP